MDDRKIFSETFLRSTSDIVLSVWFNLSLLLHLGYIEMLHSFLISSNGFGSFYDDDEPRCISPEKVLNFCIHQISPQKNSVHVSSDDIEWYMRLGCNGLSLLRNTIYDKRCKKGGEELHHQVSNFSKLETFLLRKYEECKKTLYTRTTFHRFSRSLSIMSPSRKGVSW